MARNFFYIDRGNQENSKVFGCNDGYSYHQNKFEESNGGTTLYLRCTNYYSHNCHGTARIVQITGEQEWINGNIHSCTRNFESHEVRRLRADILNECRFNYYERPRQVVNRIGARYHPDIASRIRLSRVRFAMRRARAAMYPNMPASLEELGNLFNQEAFRHLTQTTDGADSIFSGVVGPPGQQSLVFLSRRMINCMETARRVFVDATFASTPASPPAQQVFQIVTVLRNSVIPLVVALMERKTCVAYESILVHLKERAPRFKPAEVMLDFECASFRAWVNQFHTYNTIISGCYIHHIRAVLQNARDLGVRPVLADDDAISTIVRASLAIPLLPHDLLQRGLEVLRRLAELCEVDDELQPFFNYYEATWLTGWRLECLSVYNLAHRTNNACESAHRVLRLATGPLHPSMWTFLDGLRSYEQNAYTDWIAFQNGRSFGASRRTSVLLNDEAIQNFTHDLLDGSISMRKFLLNASYRVQNYVNENS